MTKLMKHITQPYLIIPPVNILFLVTYLKMIIFIKLQQRQIGYRVIQLLLTQAVIYLLLLAPR